MSNDWNQGIINEFRANGGNVGGHFEGAPLLILHTTGAKSGEPRVHPLVYQADGDNIVIFASKAGAPSHPAWYHNLTANPGARIEIGKETLDVVSRVAEGEERERLWEKQKADYPGFADYEKATDRVIPVIVLERASA
jgi:deazaflavin-dependent oxidoreductase (nitroreductase family)